VGAAAAVARAQKTEVVPPRTPLAQFPMAIADWKGVPEPPFEPAILRILGVDEYVTRAYFGPQRIGVGLYIGYYGSQRQGDTMHSPLNCLPGAGWEAVSNSRTAVSVAPAPGAAPSDVTVNRYVVRKGLDRQLVLYWYQAHGRTVASEYWSKFYLIEDAIRLNRTDGALVRVVSPILGETDADEARAEQIGVAFIKSMFPLLQNYLPS
jgi:EpsI family protein